MSKMFAETGELTSDQCITYLGDARQFVSSRKAQERSTGLAVPERIAESVKFPDLDVPFSALYLLAVDQRVAGGPLLSAGRITGQDDVAARAVVCLLPSRT
jgi:hypothetical protein